MILLESNSSYFIPKLKNEEDTGYFDARGLEKNKDMLEFNAPVDADPRSDADVKEFGDFSFRNLSELEKANSDVVKMSKGLFNC